MLEQVTCVLVVNKFWLLFMKILNSSYTCTVKPVLCSHSKIDKTKWQLNVKLTKVKSIAEC